MIGIIILTLTSFILSILLVFVDSKLNKVNDNKVEIIKHLPGVNCGACGFGSCEGMANAIEDNKDNYKKCRILRGDKLEEMKKYLGEEK